MIRRFFDEALLAFARCTGIGVEFVLPGDFDPAMPWRVWAWELSLRDSDSWIWCRILGFGINVRRPWHGPSWWRR